MSAPSKPIECGSPTDIPRDSYFSIVQRGWLRSVEKSNDSPKSLTRKEDELMFEFDEKELNY